ncbi:cellulose binding domain-containing protein [Micromonospora sp. GCM10011542]|uniref:cellulose binding domain-containing protein n=1 Tax=Micromonospora sp. GCM10011542 TaxID=3317337 RepID=UPI0036147B5A
MIEIGAQVELSHPADRVWLALTDRQVLGRWFTEVEPVAGSPDRLLLHTAALPGFEAALQAEVTERRVPELLTLRCDEAGRLSMLTCEITTTAQGCRLSVRETLEHGIWPDELRGHREQQLRQAVTVRLPAILDWLAFQQVDLRRGEGGLTAELPMVPAPERPGADRRRRTTLIAVAAVAVLVAGVAFWAVRPGEPQRSAAPVRAPLSVPTATAVASAAPRPTPSVRPSRSTAVAATTRPSRSPTPTPSRTPSSAAPPPAAALAARYQTVSTRLFGYTGEVVLDNSGNAPADGWTVVVALADGNTVDDVDGADFRQEGRSVTFTGPPLPAGQSHTFTFDVRDTHPKAKGPEGCSVGGKPCADG